MGSCFLGGYQTLGTVPPNGHEHSAVPADEDSKSVACVRPTRLSTSAVCEKRSLLKSVHLGAGQLHCGPAHSSRPHLSSFPAVSEPWAMVSQFSSWAVVQKTVSSLFALNWTPNLD